MQLFNCCELSLCDELLKDRPDIDDVNEEEIMENIKKLAVIPVSIGVRRAGANIPF